MEKRTLLAVVLSLAVLILWNIAFPPPKPAPGQVQSESTPIASPAPFESAPNEAPAELREQSVSGLSSEGEAFTSTPQNIQERHIVVQTAEFSAVLSTRGGRVVSWMLNGYKDEAGKEINMIPDRKW